MNLALVTLEYFGLVRADGPKARATARARLTPTMAIVEPGTWTLGEVRRGARLLPPLCELRFHRKTGRRVGEGRGFRSSGWEIVAGLPIVGNDFQQ